MTASEKQTNWRLPKAVVFDLGKVLLDFDYSIAARKIAARGTITLAGIAHLMAHSQWLLDYETGLVDTPEFFTRVCAATGYRGDMEECADCFGDIFTAIDPMVEFQAQLRRKGYPTYIFSNTNDLAVRHIRKRFPFFANFDGYILSYEHGSMKPEPKLYEAVERQSGFRGPDLLYLDDRPENVAAGAARGWQVILQETPDKTLAAIGRLGLL